MKTRITGCVLGVVCAMVLCGLGGCGDKPKAKDADPKKDKVSTDGGKEQKDHKAGHGGKVIALGEGTFGAYKVKATRDEGEIKAGGEAPIDVWVDPAEGKAAGKVVAVRFWVGAENAAGSVKAKAEIEDPKDPNRWHTHAEVPNPIPAGAKVWVEVEDDKGEKTLASFDLKT